MAQKQIPIQDGLYTWPSDRPQLIAGKCKGCGEITFPRQDACPGCTGRNAEEVLLSPRGIVDEALSRADVFDHEGAVEIAKEIGDLSLSVRKGPGCLAAGESCEESQSEAASSEHQTDGCCGSAASH